MYYLRLMVKRVEIKKNRFIFRSVYGRLAFVDSNIRIF